MADDFIYYNINILHIPTEEIPAIESIYDETRTQAIIENACDYYLAISRFSIDASNIPLFVCPVIQNPNNSSDINYTPYSINIIYTDLVNTVHTYQEQVIYTPSIQGQILPLPPNANRGQDFVSTRYYYVYEFQVMINMVNNTLNKCMERLKIDFPTLNIVENPYFIYNRNNNLISFYVENIQNPDSPAINLFETVYSTLNGNKYTPTPPQNPLNNGKIQIFLNFPLFKYFQSISVYSSYFINDNVNDMLIVIENIKNNIVTISGKNYFENSQQYFSLNTWSSLRTIQFFTSALPVNYEGIAINNPNNLNLNISSGASIYKPLLTDFSPDFKTALDNRETFTYNANLYRLIDLSSNIPINRIDIAIYWEDIYFNLYPLYTSRGNNIKLVFIKKELINNNKLTNYIKY